MIQFNKYCSDVSIKHLIVMVVTVQYTNTDAPQIRHSKIPFPSERCLFQNEQDAVLGQDLQPYHPHHKKTHLKIKSKYVVMIIDFERHCNNMMVNIHGEVLVEIGRPYIMFIPKVFSKAANHVSSNYKFSFPHFNFCKYIFMLKFFNIPLLRKMT